MATAAYSTHPDNAYAGFGSEGDPYNTNNPGKVLLFDILLYSCLYPTGTYDTGFGAIASNDYEYPPDSYDNDYPNGQQQQQPFYTNDYQQAPHANEEYDPRQPQHNPMNTYNQQPQNGYPNAYTQQPQNGYPNSYNQQPQANPPNAHGQQPPNAHPNAYAQQPPAHQQQYHQPKPQQQQQQPLYPNEYDQPPYSNGQYPVQQTQNMPPNVHPQQQQQQHQQQQQQPANNQQPYYPNQYDQSPYDHEDYPPPQPPSHVGQQQLPPAPHNQQPQQPQHFNNFPNQQAPKIHQRPMPNHPNNNDGFNDMNPMQPPYNQHTDNPYADSRNYQQVNISRTYIINYLTYLHRHLWPIHNGTHQAQSINNLDPISLNLNIHQIIVRLNKINHYRNNNDITHRPNPIIKFLNLVYLLLRSTVLQWQTILLTTNLNLSSNQTILDKKRKIRKPTICEIKRISQKPIHVTIS